MLSCFKCVVQEVMMWVFKVCNSYKIDGTFEIQLMICSNDFKSPQCSPFFKLLLFCAEKSIRGRGVSLIKYSGNQLLM